MKWIIKGILDVILTLVQGLLNVLAKPFLNNFALDIGANLVTVNSSNERSATSFSTAMGSILSGDSFFETVFPGIDDFCTVIMIFAIVLIIMIMIIELMKAMVLNPQEAEHPLSIVGRSLMAGMFVGLSYALFVAFEWIFNSIYFRFLDTKMDVDDSFNFFEFLTGGDSIKQLIADQTGASGVASLLCILILIMILIQFVKFVVDVTQRYVLLGVMFFTCPLPFATLASKNTSNIFKTWFKMVISQFILMIFAVFFINIFLKTMANAATITQSFNIMQYLAFMFMMYAWLLIGQKVDSYLNTMGLSAAQSAGNMLGAITGGLSIAAGAALLGKKGYTFLDSKRNNPRTAAGQARRDQDVAAKVRHDTQAKTGGDASLTKAVKEQTKNDQDFNDLKKDPNVFRKQAAAESSARDQRIADYEAEEAANLHTEAGRRAVADKKVADTRTGISRNQANAANGVTPESIGKSQARHDADSVDRDKVLDGHGVRPGGLGSVQGAREAGSYGKVEQIGKDLGITKEQAAYAQNVLGGKNSEEVIERVTKNSGSVIPRGFDGKQQSMPIEQRTANDVISKSTKPSIYNKKPKEDNNK